VPRARLRYFGYQLVLALPAAICAVAAAQAVPGSRPTLRLLSAAVIVVIWLIASARVKTWFFGPHLRQRLRDGYFDEVAELYAPAYALARTDPARVRMALLLSVCELERERYDQALEWLDKISERDVDALTRGMLLSQRARALAGRSPEAVAIAEKAVALSAGTPNEIAALTARGAARLGAGDAAAAVADFERASALAAEAGNEVPYLAAARARYLGEAYRGVARLDDAKEAFARAAAFPRRIAAARAAAAALAEADAA
jgi:tetratricopeptide (TPR) repeat protein